MMAMSPRCNPRQTGRLRRARRRDVCELLLPLREDLWHCLCGNKVPSSANWFCSRLGLGWHRCDDASHRWNPGLDCVSAVTNLIWRGSTYVGRWAALYTFLWFFVRGRHTECLRHLVKFFVANVRELKASFDCDDFVGSWHLEYEICIMRNWHKM
jgi:hypothetical protein